MNSRATFICKRCLIATRPSHPGRVRHVSQPAHQEDDETPGKSKETHGDSEPGALSRKLQEATEDALLTGGRSGLRAVQEAGFSEELKAKLQSRIASANLANSIDGHSHGQSDPSWTGEEPTTHAVLRMLDDAHKPLKPELRGRFHPPKQQQQQSAPQRVATARDRASTYAAQSGLSPEERDKLRQQFRERFEPTSRPVPVSISGLAALANERIEAAMARGQFANLPRGKPAAADPLASNPYVDTTEYLMNRIVQRQEMVPPWIEKQQELNKAARAFRVRLRDDWRRHAARMVAARGGSLEEQVEAAPGFRDEQWEGAERKYLMLAVERLNELARGYNLMAPELARKPYFELGRELRACYVDVAEELGGEIRERAVRVRSGADVSGGEGKRGGRGGSEGGDGGVYVRDTRPYGFREWWRDVWGRGKG